MNDSTLALLNYLMMTMTYIILMRMDHVCNENTTLCKECPFFAQPADDEYGGDYEDGDHEKERALHLDCAQLVGQLAHACLQL